MAYMRGKNYIYFDIDGTYKFYCETTREVIDAFVVMRYAELLKEKKNIEKYEKKVAEKYQGNFGADALCEKYKIITVINSINEIVKKRSLKK